MSNLVSMGFSDERSAEAARAAMLTNPSDEDALEAALTFLAESPRGDDSPLQPPGGAEQQQQEQQRVNTTDVDLSLPSQEQQQMEEELAYVVRTSTKCSCRLAFSDMFAKCGPMRCAVAFGAVSRPGHWH